MSDSAGSEVPSLFLLLKAALLSGDEALGMSVGAIRGDHELIVQ